MQILLRLLRCFIGFFTGNGGLTITTLTGPRRLSPCGSAEWQVRWGLAVRHATGWIIQHVRFEPDVRNCANEPIVGRNTVIEYWEGWRVVNGAIQVGFTGHPHGSDTFRTPNSGEGTRGTYTIRGRVRFLAGYNLARPPWGHTFPQAGALPTMGTEPDGWTECGADVHTLAVNWVCCPEGRSPTEQTGTLRRTGFFAWLRRLFLRPFLFASMTERPAFDASRFSPEANELIALIADMPAWADLGEKDAEPRVQIVAVARQLLASPLEIVREAFHGYIALSESQESSYDVSAMSRLYVLNRLLFALPATTEPDQPRFASFAGVPVTENGLNELWPVAREDDVWSVRGTFAGYFGEAYLALEEFDHFHQQFGLRSPSDLGAPES